MLPRRSALRLEPLESRDLLSVSAFPDTSNGIYLLSDFPVAGTDYPRLSKLVLYAALSKEAQALAQRSLSRRVKHAVTTAFTDNPVSMKYRGLFELIGRKELPRGSDPVKDHRYMLNYAAAMGAWTLDEGLAEWKAKHGKPR